MTRSKIWSDHFFFACLLCATPILLAKYPAMVDMPQHAAQIAAIRHLLTDDDWRFAGFFELHWFTPYLFGYLLVVLLSYLAGVPLALKLVLAAAVVLFPIAGSRLIHATGGDPAWRWLLLPLPFGFAYQWGFLNFLVAAPIGLIFLSLLISLRDESNFAACARITLTLHLLFAAHILTAAFFCIAGMLMLLSPWNGIRDWLRRCLPVFTILPVTVLWLWLNIQHAPSAGAAVMWDIGLHRLTDLLPSLVSSPARVAGQFLGLLFLAVPFLTGARPKRSIASWAPFALYVAWMLTFPHYLSGTFFTYQRFGLFGIPLYLVAFESRRTHLLAPEYMRSLVPGLAMIFMALLGWHCIRVLTFNREVAGYVEVMKHAKPEGRMLMMAFNPVSQASNLPLMLHFSGWYQAESGGLSEYSFSEFWGVPARFRADAPTTIRQGFEWRPDTFDWQRHSGELYDYFLIRHPANADTWIHERTDGRAVLVARSGEWQLYGRRFPESVR